MTERDMGVGWAEDLLRTLLDRWLEALDPNGLFHVDFDRQWRRLDKQARTLVSQCRLIYNFSRGFEWYGDPRFADAAHRGIEALQQYFRFAPGRYRWAVWPDGVERDPRLDSYGHAFCILALATASRALGIPVYADEAQDVAQTLGDVFTDAQGGLAWHVGEQFSQPRSQNPAMHAFEALMALHRVDPSGRAKKAAENLLGFVRKLPDFSAGALIERFTLDWKPLPTDQGGVVNLGHAFEWSYLLSDWAAIIQDDAFLLLGEKFLGVGMDWGLAADGGVQEACDCEGRIVSPMIGLWQQAEALRAVYRYITRHGHEHLSDRYGKMQSFYRERFVDDEYGGVYAGPPNLDKGDAWKLDYHSVNLCLELVGANG